MLKSSNPQDFELIVSPGQHLGRAHVFRCQCGGIHSSEMFCFHYQVSNGVLNL